MASSNSGRGLAYLAEPDRNPAPEYTPASVIPVGTVRRIRNQVEARAAACNRESVSVLIARTHRHVVENLCGTNLTYKDKLRIAEQLGLHHLTSPIAGFLRIHEDMFQAVVKTQRMAMRAATNSAIDVLTRAEICILNLRNQVCYNDILSTLNGTLLQNMRMSGEFEEETITIGGLLAAEFTRTLQMWEDRSSYELDDVELENVGPDHDIDTLGKAVLLADKETTALAFMKNTYLPTPPPSPNRTSESMSVEALMNETDDEEDDESQFCGICMEAYTDPHPAFCLAACGHIFGKTCLTKWVNSVAPNANLCPECRASLCTRRQRQPTQAHREQAMPSRPDQRVLQARLDRTTWLFGKLADAHGLLFGAESRDPFYHVCMAALNYRFFAMNLCWYVRPDEESPTGWNLQRVNWHQ